MTTQRTNRERAAECLAEARACLDQIVHHSRIGFPISDATIDHCTRLSAMYAAYMTEPSAIWGDISDRYCK